MGLYKNIIKRIPPDEIYVSGGIENLMRDMADDSTEFENMLVEYGIKCVKKRMDKETKKIKREDENPLLTMNRLIEYLAEESGVYKDMCGEDDIYNTIPASEALKDAKKVMSYLEKEHGKLPLIEQE